MDDAPIPGIHRFEGNDLTLIDCLLPKALGHRGKCRLPPVAIAFRINDNMTPLFARSIDRSMRQKLQRSKDLAALSDDTTGVATVNLDDDFGRLTVDFDFTRAAKPRSAIHAHLLQNGRNKLKRFLRAFITIVLRGLLVARFVSAPSIVSPKLTTLRWVVILCRLLRV